MLALSVFRRKEGVMRCLENLSQNKGKLEGALIISYMHRGEETCTTRSSGWEVQTDHISLAKGYGWGEKFVIKSVSQGVFSVPGKIRNKMDCLSGG